MEEAESFQAIKRRGDEEQTMTKQTPQMKHRRTNREELQQTWQTGQWLNPGKCLETIHW